MPACTTPLFRPVWCWATAGSFSRTVTSRPLFVTKRCRASASPTIPPPTMPIRWSATSGARQLLDGAGQARPDERDQTLLQIPLTVARMDLDIGVSGRGRDRLVGAGAVLAQLAGQKLISDELLDLVRRHHGCALAFGELARQIATRRGESRSGRLTYGIERPVTLG